MKIENKITVIICLKGRQSDKIYKTLDSCMNFKVILVVKDCLVLTLENINNLYKNVTIVNQYNDGLAAARNLGLQYVKTDYVLMLGSDNKLLESNNFDLLIKEMNEKKWVGIGLLTYILITNKKYFDRCLNKLFFNKIKPGEREVIGTPVLYKTSIFDLLTYDYDCSHSDDTDLGHRLKNAGYKQGYSKQLVLDIAENNLKSIIERWTRYGISDYEYYKKYSSDWDIKRKIKSWMHPLISEWIPEIKYFPFYLLIVFIRYKAWIRKAL